MQKLGVIFGGMSTENKVSVISASSVLKNLDREKYEIYPIYIDENGKWYNYTEKIETIEGWYVVVRIPNSTLSYIMHQFKSVTVLLILVLVFVSILLPGLVGQ